jgi:hypothetical protein
MLLLLLLLMLLRMRERHKKFWNRRLQMQQRAAEVV